MKWLDVIVAVVLLIGGLNWGLVGFFDYNLIAWIFGEGSAYSRLFYAVVGLSALYEVFGFTWGLKAIQHRWCEYPSTVKH